jgi:hypothetical protein
MAFGGFLEGLASDAYHASGMNREPIHSATKEIVSQTHETGYVLSSHARYQIPAPCAQSGVRNGDL